MNSFIKIYFIVCMWVDWYLNKYILVVERFYVLFGVKI